MSDGILVIGATGKTGTELVKLLAAGGKIVRAASRCPARAAIRLRGLVAVEFDFDRPETFAPALRGVDKIVLMARPGDTRPDQAAIPFVEQARKKGVRLIVNLTAIGVERNESLPLRVLEKHIEASGVPFTHLRPNWFMQNFNTGPMLADIRATGALHLPAADARISFIDIRDIAAVATAALTQPQHAGRAYTLTGAQSLDHYGVATALSRVAGRKIKYVAVSQDDARKVLVTAGVAPDLVERWTKFYYVVRQGFCDSVSSDVEGILQRPAISFDRYAADYAASWRCA